MFCDPADLRPTGYKVPSDVRFSANETGLVLLHIGRGRIFTANTIGHRIWRDALAGTSVRVIGENLAREFGVPSQCAEQHAAEFLAELIRNRLFQVVNEQTTHAT
jgi:hypothetical protein